MIIDDDLDVRPQDEGGFEAPSRAWVAAGAADKTKRMNAGWQRPAPQDSSSDSDEP